jgi:hypothetical protein
MLGSLPGARKALIIQYEDEDGVRTTEYDKPPTNFFNNNHYLTFAKGVLADKDITPIRILEVSVLEVIFSEEVKGLEALKEIADKAATSTHTDTSIAT